MSFSSERIQSRVDILLAKTLLDRSLVGRDLLRDALSEQAQSVTRGRKRPRALGAILIEKGALGADTLARLTEELEVRAVEEEILLQEDEALGKLLVERCKVLPSQIEECRRLRDEALEADGTGPVPRLAHLLREKKYVGDEDLRHAARILARTVQACVACGKRTNLAGVSSCPSCSGSLEKLSPEAGDEPWPDESGPGNTDTQELVPGLAERLGKYLLVRHAGKGGMGVVYEALDLQLNRRVALKLMLAAPAPEGQPPSQEEERFVREAQLAAKLRHPNIVTVYEAGVLEGRPYIAMQFVSGRPLSDLLGKGGLPLRQLVKILRDVALALHHAHQEGVLHRDLKPANILVDAHQTPYVTDFGLAKETRRPGAPTPGPAITLSDRVVGTPQYMSPEQALGEKQVDRRADVYSLGAILYEFLAGRPPFRGDSPIEILTKVVTEEVVPPSNLARARGVALPDRTLESICLKALAKKPAERYPTAKALADDLSRWLKGEEVKVVASGRRKVPVWALAVAGGAVPAAIVGAALLSARPPAVERELARAARLLAEERYAEAAEIYRVILERSPSQDRARLGMALARERERAERLAKAVEEVEWARRRAEEARREVERLSADLPSAPLERAHRSSELEEARARLRQAEEQAARAREALYRAMEAFREP
jgi:serine/threonine-protein kinase